MELNRALGRLNFENSVEKPLYPNQVRIEMIEEVDSKKIQTSKH